MEPLSKEQKHNLKQVIAGAEPYILLSENEDFKRWQAEVVEKRLRDIMTDILTVDRTQDAWQTKVTEQISLYQEMNQVYRLFFTNCKEVEQQAKDLLTN